MRTPPKGIEVGNSLTQEDIEEGFNTGFGYRISGINPRRDEQDRRYILLFANEEGPYSDSVTKGRFEYIGEGLEGDQSKDSPGNSALIDARSSDIPIHFFYKRAEGKDWEYQGLIDVVDYEFQQQGGRDVLVFTMKHHRQSSKNKSHDLEQRPNVGETFTAKVDRISTSGNGIIETKESHINIGPVTQESVGKEVEAKMVTAVFARCKTAEYKTDSYLKKFEKMVPPTSGTGISSKGKNGDISTIGGVEFCGECGSVMRVREGLWKCSGCGNQKEREERVGTESSGKQTSDSSEEAIDTPEVESNNQIAENDEPQKQTKEPNEKYNDATTKQTPDAGLDIDDLREKAKDGAVEEIPNDVSTTTSEKPQYNRSPEVKEYVKARAEGFCEGCGEPAPFTSNTGEPYLHAHHIHELSEGGSDTPDTVIALCPNCHYRVHHGEDGDDYNQELLEIVQDKESGNDD